LQEKEESYHTLADSGMALIWTSGTDKKCDYFNQPWLKFTGRTLEQELGDGWAEGVHPDDLAPCFRTYTEAFDRRESFSMDYRLRRHDGEFRWIQDEGTPRHDSRGNFLGYIGHCLDITERKRTEEQLNVQAEQLAQSNEELTRFNRLMAGRELRVIQMKQQVNNLAAALGRPRPYPLAFLDAAAAEIVGTACESAPSELRPTADQKDA